MIDVAKTEERPGALLPAVSASDLQYFFISVYYGELLKTYVSRFGGETNGQKPHMRALACMCGFV